MCAVQCVKCKMDSRKITPPPTCCQWLLPGRCCGDQDGAGVPGALLARLTFFKQGELIHDFISKIYLQWENRRQLGIWSVKIQCGGTSPGAPGLSLLRPGLIYVFNIWRQRLLARSPPTAPATGLPRPSMCAPSDGQLIGAEADSRSFH